MSEHTCHETCPACMEEDRRYSVWLKTQRREPTFGANNESQRAVVYDRLAVSPTGGWQYHPNELNKTVLLRNSILRWF